MYDYFDLSFQLLQPSVIQGSIPKPRYSRAYHVPKERTHLMMEGINARHVLQEKRRYFLHRIRAQIAKVCTSTS